MTDHEAVLQTISQYCQLCDEGRFNEWAQLYTEDATFHVMGEVRKGRENIARWIQAAQPPERRGKHIATNSIVEISGEEAVARTDYIFVGRGDEGLAVTSAGRYHDHLVRRGERWLFAERRIVFMGDEPQGD